MGIPFQKLSGQAALAQGPLLYRYAAFYVDSYVYAYHDKATPIIHTFQTVFDPQFQRIYGAYRGYLFCLL